MDESLRRRCALTRGALSGLLLAAVVALVSACAVAKSLERTPGVDLSAVKAGATRQQVEAVAGAPLREWTTPTGVRYRIYRYDAGIEPSKGGAAFVGFMDVITLGLWEAMAPSDDAMDLRGPRRLALLAVSYDPQDTVIGVFEDVGEFAELPQDGRAPAARAQGAIAPDR
jgi:stage V sporulation protein SpoVS